MTESIAEFLDSKGAVELLIEAGQDGATFTELLEAIPVVRSTLTERIGEAEEFELIYKQPGECGGRTTHEYHTTYRGDAVHRRIDLHGIIRTYGAYKQVRDEYEERKKRLVRWAKKNEDEVINKPVQLNQVIELLRENYPEIYEDVAERLYDID